MQCTTFVHQYPLSFIHDGTMLGNGYLGLYAWGGGNRLNVSVGCSELWDHRGGMSWTARQNYHDIKAALEAGDQEAIHRIFAPDTEDVPGQPRRPSLIPLGRIEFTLAAGARLVRNELSRLDGGLKVIYELDGGEREAELRLHMSTKGNFAFKCDDVASFVVRSSYELSDGELAKISFEAPLPLVRDDLAGFVQPMPADPAFALAVMREVGLFTCAFRRSTDVRQLSTDLQGERSEDWESLPEGYRETLLKMLPGLTSLDWRELVSSNIQWWRDFWLTVPEINIDSESISHIYYDGLFKFASMTAPDGYPAGLQGPWIEDNTCPPWQGDYHFNINIEMCYWPAFRANCFANIRRMFDMVISWKPQMRANAKNYIGIDDGYMLPHAVDDRCTCMGSFWTGTIDHACAAWTAQLMFDYCDYTGDSDFLRDDVFDFMRGTMNVFQAMLERKPDGKLVLPVSISPEYRGDSMNAWGANASFQLAAFRRLALNLVKAAQVLEVPVEASWKDIIDKLPVASVMQSSSGEQIALWDGVLLEESHRHHSHLAGLCPFDVIDSEAAEWSRIVSNSIKHWQLLGMGLWSGWCVPWAAMLQNRLNNAEAAELLLNIWKYTFNNPGGGSCHDAVFQGFTLMSSRPHIMQIDGAMGALTAVQDMFLHSRQDVIHLFAGIPMRYRSVSFSNMSAPGGFLISAIRNDNTSHVTVTARRHSVLRLVFHGHTSDKVSIASTASSASTDSTASKFVVCFQRPLIIEMKAGQQLNIDFLP